MKRYDVVITQSAAMDMESIYNYIAFNLQAPSTAMEQYTRIANEVLSLEYFPERIKLMDTFPEKRRGLRQLLVDNYSVFFSIDGNRVIVISVLYTASDIINKLRSIS